MKKILFSAAVALFAVSAFAQTSSTSNDQGQTVSSTTKGTELKGKDKGQFISDLAKKDDINKGVKLTPEERAVRKADRKAAKAIRKADRKADRNDDGIINESTTAKDSHGTAVSDMAKGTTLEGKEKGKAISTVARSKAKNGEKAHRKATKPAKVNRPAKAVKPGKR